MDWSLLIVWDARFAPIHFRTTISWTSCWGCALLARPMPQVLPFPKEGVGQSRASGDCNSIEQTGNIFLKCRCRYVKTRSFILAWECVFFRRTNRGGSSFWCCSSCPRSLFNLLQPQKRWGSDWIDGQDLIAQDRLISSSFYPYTHRKRRR